jgi:hypothetical protein
MLKLTQEEITILLTALGRAHAAGVSTSADFMCYLTEEHQNSLDRAHVNERKSEDVKRTVRQRRMFGEMVMKQRAYAKRVSNLIIKIDRSRRGE